MNPEQLIEAYKLLDEESPQRGVIIVGTGSSGKTAFAAPMGQQTPEPHQPVVKTIDGHWQDIAFDRHSTSFSTEPPPFIIKSVPQMEDGFNRPTGKEARRKRRKEQRKNGKSKKK